jgi:hypothetical protein
MSIGEMNNTVNNVCTLKLIYHTNKYYKVIKTNRMLFN